MAMFGYYVDLALRSLKRNKVLTALMVLAIALGIGTCMTTLTVLHVLSGDPMPGKSARLFYPQVDPQDMDGYRQDGDPPAQLTWIDGMNLLHAKRADRQALMTGGSVPLQPDKAGLEPFYTAARYTTADFFAMFEVPFLYGHGWREEDDEAKGRVTVISRELNDKLFDGADSTGRTLRANGADLRIVGVIDQWRPSPHFYDLNSGNYSETEDVYVPFTTARALRMSRDGSMDCWGEGGNEETLETAQCVWTQFWVELDSPAKAAAYKEYLVHYSQEQKALGRFQRPPNVRMYDLMGWMDFNKVVPQDVRLQTWLAFGFLLVCLVNTVGLMLAKFLRRAGEVGVRRALGASRRSVFAQLLTEAGMVGLAGGLLGLLLAVVGLWLVRRQPADYAALAHLDLSMLLMTFVMAGILPAWRACQVAPALQLKTQ
jgi:putative ABC transport system permease protein